MQTQSNDLNLYFENRDVQQIAYINKYVDVLSCAGIFL